VLRLRYVRTFHRFTAQDLQHRLAALGIALGDALFVHSSYNAFEGFSGRPTDVIDVLQKAVGEDGLLMMPTMPFTGTAVDYARRHPMLDLARTASRMGLITELFRRSAGVVRSAHPTHPVAIWGKEASSVASGHNMAETPCDEHSPFASLLERNAKILFLGVGIESCTFYHFSEHVLDSALPQSPFTTEVFALATRLQDGSVLPTRTRLFDPAVSRRRTLVKLLPEIERMGGLVRTRIGRLDVMLLRAADTHRAACNLAARGVFCYD